MNKPVVFSLFAIFILQSCIHSYYVPNAQNVPLFSEKGEFQFSGQIGSGEFSSSREIQTAVAITNNIGLAANYMNTNDGNLDKDDYTKGNYLEAAIGYFRPTNKKGIFEIYGGFGNGRQHHSYKFIDIDYEVVSTIYNKADLSYTKLYLQPAYGFNFNICQLAFSTRFSSLSFNKPTSDINRDWNIYRNLLSLSDKNHILLEPAITFRIGWEIIKAQVQYSYSGYLNNDNLDLFDKQHISIGFVFYLNKNQN